MKKVKIGKRAILIQGDCLEVLPKLPQVDFIFTDPPYGHDNNDDDLAKRREHALKNQNKEDDEARPILNDDYDTANRLFTESLPLWKNVLPTGGVVCCCCGGGGGHKGIQFARWSLQLADHFTFDNTVVWDKGPLGMGWRYRRSWECVLVAFNSGKAKWYNTSGTVENIVRPGDYGVRKTIPAKDQHPTEKPPELAAHFIRNHTQENEVVLDPFMGSCSTGVAALASGRRFVGIELDTHWFDRSVERLRHVTKYGIDLQKPAKGRAKSTEELGVGSIW